MFLTQLADLDMSKSVSWVKIVGHSCVKDSFSFVFDNVNIEIVNSFREFYHDFGV
jgi:hypothetical protein